MKFYLILVMFSVNLFQTIDSKLYRVMVEDTILPYIDKSIPFITEYFSLENLILEQIDDDNVQIGGYLEAKKSMDRNLPLSLSIRTQVYERATWNEAALKMTVPSMCPEFTNPLRFWYNATKLFSLDVCPAKIGDKWEIESGILTVIQDVPPTMPILPWRMYGLFSQGIPGFEKFKFGIGFQFQFLPVE